ncbi:uncharacterized protein [Ptychodera flava]|uniref:uncharacterized protein n=1 Tax=Ptychodera flava TaxID=63121 RepID=UPI00396A4C58
MDPHNTAPRSSNNVEGFIVNVSPLKTSAKNAKYFNGVIQTQREQYQNIVCFSPDKHEVFTSLLKSKSPIKLQNVDFIPSRANPSVSDIQVSKRSGFQGVQQLSFSMKKPTPKTTNIAEVADMAQGFGPITITAKVLRILSVKKQQNVRGKIIDKQSVLVADSSGSVELTLWAGLIDTVDIDSTYTFTALSVRRYEFTTLTTTPQTAITTAGAIDHKETPIEDILPPTQLNIEEIVQVSAKMTTGCSACHTPIVTPPSTVRFVKCTFCFMRQKTTAMVTKYTCNVNVKTSDNQTMKLTIPNQIILDFFEEQQTPPMDTDTLEEYLLDASHVQMSVRDNRVVGMTILPPTMDVEPDAPPKH